MINELERATISADGLLGAGNVLHRLLAHGRNPDEQVLWTDQTWQAPDGSTPEVLTLGELDRAVRACAGFHHHNGVRPRDVVAVITGSSTEYALHFLALSSLGAIPSLVHADLPADTLRAYLDRQDAVGALATDHLHEHLTGLGFVHSGKDIRPEDAEHLPADYPWRHHPDDPVIITHSSGTTGVPKAVPHTHRTLLLAPLERIRLGDNGDEGRRLVALPGNHNATISVLLSALLLRVPVLLSSDRGGAAVLAGIERFQPGAVFAFASTYAELSTVDLDAHDLSGIGAWYNTGDAAHETHIRALTAHGNHMISGPGPSLRQVPGSLFHDGLGSTEIGYVLFLVTHRPGDTGFGRRIGKPLGFAQAVVLGDDGSPLPPGQVGRLGVRTPTLTPGYWNDSGTWHRQQLGGYWLTGDLVHQDPEGEFYHHDREPDAIRTTAGTVLSTSTEELLLQSRPELRECTVIGHNGEAHALLQFANGLAPQQDLTEWVNEVLTAEHLPPVHRARAVTAAEVPLGVTGKVLKRVLRERLGAHR
ncbi:class I adenylate-forming enzyme family protein [Crossiella sp. CA198]|uniref:class I adenylate-forming enzyme family protein n=1 Tax=Crossiella sp. CA198 TaxID=3455607 RepID=UPI003F8D269C